MKLRRMEQAGAVFTEDLSSVNSLKKRGFTVTGNPTVTNGPIGKALDFNGSSYITLGTDIEKELRFDGSTQDFSISAWVRRDATGTQHIIFDKREAVGNGFVFFIASSDTIGFGLNLVYPATAETITDTNWHHVVVTADRDGNGIVYLDGVAGSGTSINGQTLATTIAPSIAARSYDNGNKFNGAIKNLMFFDRVLTAAEITALAKNQPFDYEKNVVSEWDMSDTNPRDVGYRGLGNNGTGVSLTAASIVNGISNDKAIYLDGSADYIDIGDITDLDNIDFSVSAWIKTSQIPAITGMIMSKKRDTGYGFFLATHTDGKARIFFNSASAASLSAYTTTAVNDGAWHHVVFTADRDGNIISYKDGVAGTPVSIAAGDGESIDNDASLRIGVGGQTFLAFNGVIDKVIIFDKVLTNLEVMDIYKKQKGGRR